jgi:4-hydroxy-3-methylbut-2-enyl diphosphate reductase
MCFGVRDALRVIDRLQEPEAVTIHGELVHNEIVLEQLQLRGFHRVEEHARRALPGTPAVLITAHGISNAERRRLQDAGKRLVDTTCPLVERAHAAAQELQRDDRHVLLIGRRGHVEVQGIIEDLHSVDVIGSPEEVTSYPFERLGILCQTTAPARLVQSIRERVGQLNPRADIRFIDTVCLPTREHQKALERLLEQVQAVVVVGGAHSNNTRELVVCCRERGLPAYHVQSAADLRRDWFTGIDTVGLTAGTSTLDETIAEVKEVLGRMEGVG